MILINEIEKPDDATLILRRTLNTTTERAFAVWTSPEHVRHWLCTEPGMTVPSIRMDVRVGGKFRLQMKKANGEFFTAVGEYREVRPPERLVYTWDWEKDGSEPDFGEVEGKTSQVTVEFLSRGEHTEMVLNHTRFASTQSRDGHAQGWGQIIASFAGFLEKA